VGKRKEYYMGEGGVVLLVACPNTKNDSECGLTNVLVGFDVGPNN
jgi:hypothetical protein